MGTVSKIARQRCHLAIWMRLSAPISQTKRTSGARAAKRLDRIGGVLAAEPGLDIGDDDAPVRAGDRPGLGEALGQGRHAVGGLKRVLRRDEPPDLIEIEPFAELARNMEVAFMGGIERAAKQADPGAAPIGEAR